MAKLFLSYRRADSQAITDRIYEALVEAFGRENVFQDVSGIPAGVNFKAYLEQAVGDCDVVLVVIGQQWLTIQEEDGKRRLDNPSDYVRIEIEAGLKRDGVLVIPLLVDNVRMPTEAELPDSLRSLHFLQSAKIRYNPDFSGDMAGLIQRIRDYMKESTAQRRIIASKGQSRKGRAGLAVIGMVMLAALIVVAVINPFRQDGQRASNNHPSQEATLESSPTASPTLTPSPTATFSPTATHGATSPSQAPVATDPSEPPVSPETHVIIPAGDTLKVGYASPLTGDYPIYFIDWMRSAQIAIQDRNEAGGIQGFPVEMVTYDNPCTSEAGDPSATEFAANPEIAAVMTTPCSVAIFDQLDIYYPRRIPVVAVQSGSSSFGEQTYDIYNNIGISALAEDIMALRFMYYELGVLNLMIMYDKSDPHSVEAAPAIRAEFEQLGGTNVTVNLVGFSNYEADMAGLLSPYAENPPDAIYIMSLIGSTKAGELAIQVRALGWSDTAFFPEYSLDDVYIESAGDAAEGSYIITIDDYKLVNRERAAAFQAQYATTFGTGNRPSALYYKGYDAAAIILHALEAVARVDEQGNLVIWREALIDAIRHTTNAEGITGTLRCDPDTGDCGSFWGGFLQVIDGQWEIITVPDEVQLYQRAE